MQRQHQETNKAIVKPRPDVSAHRVRVLASPVPRTSENNYIMCHTTTTNEMPKRPPASSCDKTRLGASPFRALVQCKQTNAKPHCFVGYVEDEHSEVQEEKEKEEDEEEEEEE